MKSLVLFYSYTGNTQALARDFCAREGCEIAEITDLRRPGKLKAYLLGCPAAIRGRAWPIGRLSAELAGRDRLVLFSPVWASNPPPAVNAALESLPEGMAVAVKMVSASGRSGCRARLEAALAARGCTLESFEDLKA